MAESRAAGAPERKHAHAPDLPRAAPGMEGTEARPLTLQVNGREERLHAQPRRTLLDALRLDLGLTGAKKACDTGNCGACTVLVDGRAVYACLALAVDSDGYEITTIEGLGEEGRLDPLQLAFLEADAFQCGFCTPGQIMSLKALFRETEHPSDEQIVRAVSGNLCRCGAYTNILRAARIAAGTEPRPRETAPGDDENPPRAEARGR